MPDSSDASLEFPTLLARALASQHVHSAYLLSGSGDAPERAALRFARGLACSTEAGDRPCENCGSCRRSAAREVAPLDGTGKRGPLFRHIGDHPDLLWTGRGPRDTRVRIGQVRAIQAALRLGSHEGGWRCAVVADAQWLNLEAQNALLHVLEEPPPRTALLLVTQSPAGLLPTIRSRCQRVRFPSPPAPPLRGESAPEALRTTVARLDTLGGASLPDLLDWASEYRGERGAAADALRVLLATGSRWLRERVTGSGAPNRELEAWRALSRCRKDLDQRNANPQMVAERALLSLRGVAGVGAP